MTIVRKLVTGDRVRGIKSGRVGEVQGPGPAPEVVIVLWDGDGIPTNAARKYLRLLGPPDDDGSDMVNHPPHYTSGPRHTVCGEVIECIDVTEQFMGNRANAIKYLWRAGAKDDDLTDLRKSLWYVQREIARVEREAS